MALDTQGSKVHSPPLLGMTQWKSEENDNLLPACHFIDEETEAQSGKVSFLMWDGQLTAHLK